MEDTGLDRGFGDREEWEEESPGLDRNFWINTNHKVRELIGVILGASDLLAEETSETTNELARFLRRNAMNLMETLTSVLHLAQIECGAYWPDNEPIDVIQEIDAACALYGAEGQGRNFRVEVDHPDERVEVYADSNSFGCVMHNLLTKARKSTPYGGIHITVKTSSVDVTICIEHTVKDITDAGFPFVSDTFSINSAGTLSWHDENDPGLMLSKRLIELMHGKMEVVNKEGKESTVRITLPLIGASESPSKLDSSYDRSTPSPAGKQQIQGDRDGIGYLLESCIREGLIDRFEIHEDVVVLISGLVFFRVRRERALSTLQKMLRHAGEQVYSPLS